MNNFSENFKEFLQTKDGLRNETKRIYLSRLNKFVFSKNVNSIDKINVEKIIEELQSENKTYISQTKNALKLLYRANDEFFFNNDIEKLQETAPKQRKKPEQPLKLSKVNRKINAIRNKKMKLAYRLQEMSGLRISEIADLRKQDIKFCENNRLAIYVKDGKGGKQRYIKTLDDKYLYKELKEFMDNTDKEKLFYSDRYMQQKARQLEFHTHDLRKVNAKILYDRIPENKEKTIETIQKILGHKPGTKTVYKYLNRDIDFTGTKYN